MAEALSLEVADTDDKDVRTVARKGTGRGRVEILGRERRRNWTAEQKRAIVAESLDSELTPTEVGANTRSAAAIAWR